MSLDQNPTGCLKAILRILQKVIVLFLITATASGAETRPNIVLILADDLGYCDSEMYGCDLVPTPNLKRIADEALKFITGQTVKEKPFFVVVWYSTPHRDFEASKEDVAPYLGCTDESSALLLGELAAMDRSLGTLRQGLRDLDIDKNTLVWFTSDNGGLPDIAYRPDLPGVHPDSTGHL
jgi:hypothetical protein